MSSAKAALESDTRMLAYEAGRKYKVRVNTISAGPLGSRAAKAIGFIDDMIRCAQLSSPAAQCLLASFPAWRPEGLPPRALSKEEYPWLYF